MPLLQGLPYEEYKYALTLSKEQCVIIAALANLKKFCVQRKSFKGQKKPGELLMKDLYLAGYSASQCKKLIASALNGKPIIQYFKPEHKVAILIANDVYNYLSNLGTPSSDCESLATVLGNLGFICIIIKNTTSSDLKSILENVMSTIPKNSYCFIFYAGHGCEIFNTKCALGVTCPTNDIKIDDCVTENWILEEVAKCEPELCVLIMDMCRIHIEHSDEYEDQNIHNSFLTMKDKTIGKNVIIIYTTQTSEAAYEVLNIECSSIIDPSLTYELKSGDIAKVIQGVSQYASVLCNRLTDNCDISTLLDKVNMDVENSIRKQKPIKVQHGDFKRSLFDQAQGDAKNFELNIKEILNKWIENCTVL